MPGRRALSVENRLLLWFGLAIGAAATVYLTLTAWSLRFLG
jgi:hypothetical protein